MSTTGAEERRDVVWVQHAGRLATVHVPEGSFAAGRAAGELRGAERVVAALQELLEPPDDAVAWPVELYLVDPPADPEASPGPQQPVAPDGDAVGTRAVVRTVRPDGPGDPAAGALARLLVRRWFGADAAEAEPFVEGVAGVVAARTATGPALHEADEWVRVQLAAGHPVALVGAPQAAGGGAAGPPPGAGPAGAAPPGMGPTGAAPGMGLPDGSVPLAGAGGPAGVGLGPPDGAVPVGVGAGPSLRPGSGASLRARPGGYPEADGSTLAATSFVAFVLRSYGPDSLRRYLAAYRRERRDDAAIAVYQQPLAAVAEQWQAELRRAQRGMSRGAVIRYLLPLLKPHRWRYAELLVLQVVAGLTALALPLASECVINGLRPRGPGGPAGAPPGGRPGGLCAVVAPSLTAARLAAVVLGLALVYVLDGLLGLRRAQLENAVFRGIGASLQERMFAWLQRLSHRFYGQARVGELTSRLSGDTKLLEGSISQLFGTGMLMVVTLVVTTVTVVVKSPLVGLVLVFVVPVFVVSRRVLSSRIVRSISDVQRSTAEAMAIAQENLSAHAVVKAFGLEPRARAAYGARLRAQVAASARMAMSMQLMDASLGLASTLAQLIVLGVGGYLAVNSTVGNPGELAALLLLVQKMVGPLSVLSDVEKALQQSGVAVERINAVLEEPVDVTDRPDAEALPPLSEEIRFEGVTFAYEDRPVLCDVDLRIPAGATVAVVGTSGSGKSTVGNLIMRFWDPQQGRVLFDGHDLREVTLASLRTQIALVFQDTFVFNSTLRDNIAIGRLDATDAEIEAAARDAQLETYIASLPAGLDTVLGERGVRMSGGQRQRLAIARALLRDPRLLLLDEATSSLDPHTEAEILETLDELSRTRTTITITHRLVMAVRADMVVVFDQGRLVEQGTHDGLVGAGGLYQELYEKYVREGAAGGQPRLALAASRLERIPLFSGLSAEALGQLAHQVGVEHFEAGQDLVRQGEPGEKLYVIAQGLADVYVADGGGERRVNTLKETDYFGELSLLTGRPRSATVRAQTPTDAYVLGRGDFLALVEREPSLRQQLSTLVGQRRAAYDAAALAAGLADPGAGGERAGAGQGR